MVIHFLLKECGRFTKKIAALVMMCAGAGILFSTFGYTGTSFKLPVTYYDFRSDNSALEFGSAAFDSWYNAGHMGDNHTATKGIVKSTLDAEKRPVMTDGLDLTLLSSNVGRYFREGSTGNIYHPADTILTAIDSTCTPFDLGGGDTLWTCDYVYDSTFIAEGWTQCDTCMKNIRIPDSITFTKSGTKYVFGSLNLTDQVSGLQYPIDGKGFGAEGAVGGHNECFTMDLHNRFVYHGGERLKMGSNDDGWLFINGRLAADIGGFHWTVQDSISLDTFNLTVGQKYFFDAFWVARCGGGSFYLETDLDFVGDSGTSIKVNAVSHDGAWKDLDLGGKMTIKVPTSTASMVLDFYDGKGRMIKSMSINDVSDMSSVQTSMKTISGLYFVKARCRDVNYRLVRNLSQRIVNLK